MNRSIPKSPIRLQVESIIQAGPKTAREVIDEIGEDAAAVHRCLSAIVKANQAHNTRGELPGAAIYKWGPIPVVERETVSRIPKESLKQGPGGYVREGGKDAFGIRSRMGDEYRPHGLPISMASKVAQTRYL